MCIYCDYCVYHYKSTELVSLYTSDIGLQINIILYYIYIYIYIYIKHLSIIVGTVYIPPKNSENSNINTFDDITDDVSYIISQYSTGDDIPLMGNFNARTGCMNDTYENDIDTDDYLDCTHAIDYNLPIRNYQDKTINH